jgi:hypothetical protein
VLIPKWLNTIIIVDIVGVYILRFRGIAGSEKSSLRKF